MLKMVALSLLSSCAQPSTPPPQPPVGVPTCSRAVAHYYDAGCVIVVDGSQLTEPEVVDACQDFQTMLPETCDDETEDLRSCWGSVPTPATTNSDCDCATELTALSSC